VKQFYKERLNGMKKPLQYIIFTCAVSWLIAGIAILLGLRLTNTLVYTVFAAAYMFLPAVCTIVLQLLNKERPFRNVGISFEFNRWFFIAGLVPFIYTFLTLCVSLLLPGVSLSLSFEGFLSSIPGGDTEAVMEQLSRFPPVTFLAIQVLSAIIAGYSINALFAFGEELGWRGYLLKALESKKFLTVSLITGVVWGLWHFPLILLGHNYPQHPVAGVGMMVIWCILLSPIMTYIVIMSKSLITAAIFHGCLNAIAGIPLLLLVGGNDLTKGVTGIAGFAALLLVNLAFFIYDRYFTKQNIFLKSIAG
jgi:membrane protease YdiL (CAAX protease family)